LTLVIFYPKAHQTSHLEMRILVGAANYLTDTGMACEAIQIISSIKVTLWQVAINFSSIAASVFAAFAALCVMTLVASRVAVECIYAREQRCHIVCQCRGVDRLHALAFARGRALVTAVERSCMKEVAQRQHMIVVCCGQRLAQPLCIFARQV
jgi:hypothetical protein